MRAMIAIAIALLLSACAPYTQETETIFISVAASYGKEGEVNYLANPPGDQRALSEQLSYIASRKGIPYREYLFLESDGRMSISGDERPWGRKDILTLLETLEADEQDLIIFHYAGHGDQNGSFVMPEGTRLNPDDLLYSEKEIDYQDLVKEQAAERAKGGTN